MLTGFKDRRPRNLVDIHGRVDSLGCSLVLDPPLSPPPLPTTRIDPLIAFLDPSTPKDPIDTRHPTVPLMDSISFPCNLLHQPLFAYHPP